MKSKKAFALVEFTVIILFVGTLTIVGVNYYGDKIIDMFKVNAFKLMFNDNSKRTQDLPDSEFR